MTNQKYSMTDLTITLVIDDAVTGLWCHQCNLPSAILVTYHGESDSGRRMLDGEIHRCDDDETHVLYEREL